MFVAVGSFGRAACDTSSRVRHHRCLLLPWQVVIGLAHPPRDRDGRLEHLWQSEIHADNLLAFRTAVDSMVTEPSVLDDNQLFDSCLAVRANWFDVFVLGFHVNLLGLDTRSYLNFQILRRRNRSDVSA